MIVSETHSRGLSNQLIDLVSSKVESAFVLESYSDHKVTSDKSAIRYIEYLKKIFGESIINFNAFNVSSKSIKNAVLAINYLSKEKWGSACRDDYKSVLDVDKEDCYAITSVLCKMKKKQYSLDHYRYPTQFRLSAHALRRMYQRLSIVSNEDIQNILDELQFCSMFSAFYDFYFYTWQDTEYVNKLSVPIPTRNGLFLCKLNKTTRHDRVTLFARTFLSDKDLREEQLRLKNYLLSIASKISHSQNMISYAFFLTNSDELKQACLSSMSVIYQYLLSVFDDLANAMITYEQFGNNRDYEVFKLKDRMKKDFSDSFKKSIKKSAI